MKNDYVCPFCRGYLKVKNSVIFSARKENGEQGLLLMSPEIGNYTVQKHRSFRLVDGERTDLYCPICHANLMAQNYNENLARIIQIDEENEENIVLISEIVGERCTYVIHGKKVEKYGDDAVNYFGAGGDF
ncbi:MAG: hypothetical protein U5N26_07355 [Candidatus Marinimicrobia bacterium]|nr:hypothetical protein [Candidatus Neomarinimicrobiota bacterium]